MIEMTGHELYTLARAYRRRVGCTLKSFADACGVASSTIEGWRQKNPSCEIRAARVVEFISGHPDGFDGAGRARRETDHTEGGATAVWRARQRSAAPARPCPRAVAAAAREDAWARSRRQGSR